MVVRELVALMGIKTDPQGFKKAESKMTGLINLAKTAALAFAGFKVVGWVRDFIRDASAVNETLNVLDASFEDSQQSVIEWAEAFGKAAGRSQYEMREMAATLGAVLNPMMEGNAQEAAEMSKNLSALTVDLASFFNAVESDVLIALRSGITGEAEPLKRFGVVMNQATLEAFALSEGLNKSIKSMSNAEKTALRYRFIMSQTVKAQGDAVKTASGFANISKALGARMKDAGIRIGLQFLPVLEDLIPMLMDMVDSASGVGETLAKMIRVVGKVVVWFFKLSKNMSPATKGLILFVAALSKWQLVVRLLLSPVTKLILGIAFLILLFDDLITFVKGGDSLFGRLIKKLEEFLGIPLEESVRTFLGWFGRLAEDPGKAMDELLGGIKQFAEAIRYFFVEFIPDMIGDGLKLAFGEESFGIIDTFVESVKTVMQFMLDAVLAPFKLIKDVITEVFEFGIMGALNNLGESITAWLSKIGDKIFGFGNKIKDAFNIFRKGGSFKDISGALTGRNAIGGTSIGSGASGGIVNAPNTTIQATINAGPGMNEQRLASEATRQIANAQSKVFRKAMKSVTVGAA